MTHPDPDDLLEGCLGPIVPTPLEWLPWVVLFASAFDHPPGPVRVERIDYLAAAYRELFG